MTKAELIGALAELPDEADVLIEPCPADRGWRASEGELYGLEVEIIDTAELPSHWRPTPMMQPLDPAAVEAHRAVCCEIRAANAHEPGAVPAYRGCCRQDEPDSPGLRS